MWAPLLDVARFNRRSIHLNTYYAIPATADMGHVTARATIYAIGAASAPDLVVADTTGEHHVGVDEALVSAFPAFRFVISYNDGAAFSDRSYFS